MAGSRVSRLLHLFRAVLQKFIDGCTGALTKYNKLEDLQDALVSVRSKLRYLIPTDDTAKNKRVAKLDGIGPVLEEALKGLEDLAKPAIEVRCFGKRVCAQYSHVYPDFRGCSTPKT